jgi:hypothetical protein
VEPTRPATEYGYVRTAHSNGPGLFASKGMSKANAVTAARPSSMPDALIPRCVPRVWIATGRQANSLRKPAWR